MGNEWQAWAAGVAAEVQLQAIAALPQPRKPRRARQERHRNLATKLLAASSFYCLKPGTYPFSPRFKYIRTLLDFFLSTFPKQLLLCIYAIPFIDRIV